MAFRAFMLERGRTGGRTGKARRHKLWKLKLSSVEHESVERKSLGISNYGMTRWPYYSKLCYGEEEREKV